MARTPPDAATMTANWKAGMNATNAQKYSKAIQRVTVNPMQLALATVTSGFWLSQVQASVPRLEAALSAADPAMWKSQAAGAGASAWQNSAAKGGVKYGKKSGQLAQAALAASQAASAAGTSSTARWQASVNAMRAQFGKGPVS